MKYSGEKCFHCGSEFKDTDDVVVCPECGTPYHRECYNEAGSCTNTELHKNGGEWGGSKTEAPETEPVKSEMPDKFKICPVCLTKNNIDDKTCSECGLDISDDRFIRSAEQFSSAGEENRNPDLGFDINKQYLGFDPEEDMGRGVMLKETAQFVDSNTIYYLPIFKRMKDAGTKFSFNIVCLLFPYFYFANRKMWFWALLTVFLTVAFNVPEFIYLIGSQNETIPMMQPAIDFISENEAFIKSMMDVCSAANWVLKIGVCIFGNWLYYRFTTRSVSRLKARYGGPVSPQCLRAHGGVKPVNVLIISLILIALTAVLFYAVLFVFVFLQQSGII